MEFRNREELNEVLEKNIDLTKEKYEAMSQAQIDSFIVNPFFI